MKRKSEAKKVNRKGLLPVEERTLHVLSQGHALRTLPIRRTPKRKSRIRVYILHNHIHNGATYLREVASGGSRNFWGELTGGFLVWGIKVNYCLGYITVTVQACEKS